MNQTNSAPTVPQGRPLPSRSASPSLTPVTPVREGLGRSQSAQAALPSYNGGFPAVNYDTRPATLQQDHRSRSESSPDTSISAPKMKSKFSLSDFSKHLTSNPAPQSSSSHISLQSSSSSTRPSAPISEGPEDEDEMLSPITPLDPEPSHGQLLLGDGPASPHIEDELLMGVCAYPFQVDWISGSFLVRSFGF